MQQQVLDLLIEQLAKIVEAQENQPRLKPSHESDVRLPDLAQAVLGSRPEGHEEWRPLYDAAWDLCRIGVLRPDGQEATCGAVGRTLSATQGRRPAATCDGHHTEFDAGDPDATMHALEEDPQKNSVPAVR